MGTEHDATPPERANSDRHPGWVFEPFVTPGGGDVLLRLGIDDGHSVATMVVRPDDLSTVAHLTVELYGRLDEARRIADDLVETGVWSRQRRDEWLRHRCVELGARLEVDGSRALQRVS